jgi:hypothetical protein
MMINRGDFMNRFVMMAVLFFYCSFLVACSQTSNDEVSVNMDELKKTSKNYNWEELQDKSETICSDGVGGTSLASTAYEELTAPIYRGDDAFKFEVNGDRLETVKVFKPYTINILHKEKKVKYTMNNSRIYEGKESNSYAFYTLLRIENHGDSDVQIYEDEFFKPICGLEIITDDGDVFEYDHIRSLYFDYNSEPILEPGQQKQTYILFYLDDEMIRNEKSGQSMEEKILTEKFIKQIEEIRIILDSKKVPVKSAE